MTLLEAFRTLGPYPVDDADETARREEAAAIVFRALERLVRRTRYSGDTDADQHGNAVTNVFMRVHGAGPRGTRDGDPVDDPGVERWFMKSLGRALLDELRKEGRSPEHLVDPSDLAAYEIAEDSIDEAAGVVEMAIGRAQQRLFDEIVPGIAARLQSGNTFARTVSIMRAIKAGQSLADAVGEGAGEDPAAVTQARNRLYQRFHRVLRHLHDEINRLEEAGKATPEEASYLRAFTDALRLRS